MRQRTSYEQDLSLSKLATDYRTPTVYNERMARALVWNTQTTYTHKNKNISSVTGIMFDVTWTVSRAHLSVAYTELINANQEIKIYSDTVDGFIQGNPQ